MTSLVPQAWYAASPLPTVWASPLLNTWEDDRLRYLFLRARGWKLIRMGIWTENFYARRSRLSCVGQVITWVPVWVSDEDGSWDRNKPGEHAPRTDLPPGMDLMDSIHWITTHGHICDWCKVYIPSAMEVITNNIMKPNVMFQHFNKQPWRSHYRPHPYKKY